MFDREDPNGSNGSSPDNVEAGTDKFEFDGTEFQIRETEDEIEVIAPDDYPDEKKPEVQKRAQEYLNTLASAKRKAFDANQREAELRKKEAELRQREADLNLRATAAPVPQSANSDMLKAFGVESIDDLQVLQVENPQAFYERQANYMAALSTNAALSRMQEQSTEQAIRAEGYNAQEVKEFARLNGIAKLDVAFDYFKHKTKKPAGTSLADIQKKTVKFISNGAGAPPPSKPKPKEQSYKQMCKQDD